MRTGRQKTVLIGKAARFVVLTGLSGSGKSQAVRALEDLGYFCVDNLPTSLVSAFAELTGSDEGGISRAAVVVDLRDPDFLDEFPAVLKSLRRRKRFGAVAIFLEASDEVLVRRFSETRRPHPMGADQSLLEGIITERNKLDPIKQIVDKVLDTSDLTVHELRRMFTDLSQGGPTKQLVITLMSFGFKHGVPLEADLMLDVRFLPNPHFVPRLRPLSGRDKSVQAFLDKEGATDTFLEKTTDLMRFLIPRYAAEGKSYLTVAVGCTGGRHRSVFVAEQLRRRLTRAEGVRLRIRHRDMFLEG